MSEKLDRRISDLAPVLAVPSLADGVSSETGLILDDANRHCFPNVKGCQAAARRQSVHRARVA
jgi:hypothetical protein